MRSWAGVSATSCSISTTTGRTLEAIVDPAQGSLELSLAIVGGTLSGAYVAGLLGAPIGRWLRAAALPLLFVLGSGKLAMVLGGSGQGLPSDLPWATAYVGPGPWGSLAPALPSHPSQLYEGIATLAVLAVLTLALASGRIVLATGGSSSPRWPCGRSPGPRSRSPGATRRRPPG